ncbi:MAG: hypothetical protein QXX79_01940 [Candidatus Bathyarchaeia archaeon]
MISSCDPCGGDAVTGMIPVFSASGERLASCGPLKALRLLAAGKALACWDENEETFYLRLRFNPKSEILVPNGEQAMVSLKNDMEVWRMLPPRRKYVEKLVKVAEARGCLESLEPEDKAFLEALLRAKWDEIRSSKVLARAASIVKAILKSLAKPKGARVEDNIATVGEEGGEKPIDVWNFVGTDSSSLMNLFHKAKEAFNGLGRSIRQRQSLTKDEWSILKVLENTFKKGLIKRVVSPVLMKVLAPIVRKLLKVVGMGFRLTPPIQSIAPKTNVELIRGALALKLASALTLARKAAQRIASIAQSWGNSAACEWLKDEGFIKYLALAS